MSDNPEGSAPEEVGGGAGAGPNPAAGQVGSEAGGWPPVPTEFDRPPQPSRVPPEPSGPSNPWLSGGQVPAFGDSAEKRLPDAPPPIPDEVVPDPSPAPAVPPPQDSAPEPWPTPALPTPHGSTVEPPPGADAAGDEPARVDPFAGWTPDEHDLIPLLPRGRVIFEGIPSEAVVIAALAPAIVHGAVIVRKPEAVGVVLVKDGALFEQYAFQGTSKLFGEAALNLMSGWTEATVAAYLFDPLIVDVAPSLFRGNPCYEDLRLAWTDWQGLLSDLCSRPGSYVVELDTPLGRGVTLIRDGRQVATYTERHPELGEATLLDPLAATRRGTIWVRRDPKDADDTAEDFVPAASGPAETFDTQDPLRSGSDWSAPPPWRAEETPAALDTPAGFSQEPYVDPFATSAALPPDRPPKARWGAPPPSIFDPEVQTPTSPIASMAPELKRVARERLQRSASRVEAMVDEAVARNLPLDGLLVQIRGLVIRGIMQSTLDEVVSDMAAVAARPPV